MAPATGDNNTNSSNTDFDDTKIDNNDTFAEEEVEKDPMSAKHGGKFEYFKCDPAFETKEENNEHMNAGMCSKK
ncbi:hypothetical protein P8452_55570 [Trifolium repens]|jgi:hypothetical protein|nr:hypothetical protein P8452_55570 [Trifolium repens]